ncbi:MAG: polysaccharide biosynthesis tyrosine autokinase [Epsilonproteobacteria bacterium]|nr:polysaccharide biosynthesis tyrosine autokinase [Campylobacterota bacterium]
MRALSELKQQSNIQEDEIDLKEIWSVIVRRKILIASIGAVVFLLSIIYAFWSTNIYSTYASIEIEEDTKLNRFRPEQVDIFAGEIGNSMGIDNEIEMLKSRELLLKLMSVTHLNTRYFQEGVFKDTELYADRPFDLQMSEISGDFNENIVFDIKIIDKNSYYIHADIAKDSVKPLEIDGEYKFGQTVNTPYFAFMLKATKAFGLQNGSYKITYQSNKNSFIDEFIRPNLNVAQISKNASIVKISFEDTIPQRGVDIVNSLVKVYFDQKLSFQREEVEEKLKFVNNQLAITHDNLSKSQVAIKDFKQSNTVATIPNSASTLLTTLVDVDTQIAGADMKLGVLEGLMRQMSTSGGVASVSIDALGVSGSSMNSIITALQQKRAARDALLAEFTDKHPDVVELSNEIRSLESSLRGSVKSLYNSVQKQKADLIATKNKYESSLSGMPNTELGMMNLSRNFEVNQKMYLYLLEKKAEFEIMNAASISKNRILDNAILYPHPVKPKRSLIMMVGLILGLILGLFAAFIKEFFNNKIITPEDVERITDIPMYGVLPSKAEETAFAESLNMIRTNMEFISSGGKSKVIVISSNIPEEGKTSVSANLVRTLAKGNKKVVLLDLDMRKSKLLREFPGVNVKEGVSSILIDKVSIDDAIIHVEENLDVIFAGKNPPNPSELLLSPNIEKIVNKLKEKYDYVIIDTAPIGLVTDTMILLKKHIHDLFLIVLRSEFTDKALLANFNKMAHKHHLHSVGLILNDIKISQDGYYGYGYGYGYGVDEKTK